MTNDEIKAMADRIKERRGSLGFTQELFAETVDLSASAYTKIENAFQKPALDTLIRISVKLDVSLDYLVFGKERPKKPSNTEQLHAILDFADPTKLEHMKDLIEMISKVKMR